MTTRHYVYSEPNSNYNYRLEARGGRLYVIYASHVNCRDYDTLDDNPWWLREGLADGSIVQVRCLPKARRMNGR